MGGDDHQVHKWVSPLPEIEPDVRRAIDEVFQDLQYVDDDPDMTRTFLDGISAPLERLHALGLQLVGVSTSGTLALPVGPGLPVPQQREIPWQRTHYIVAPDPADYRLPSEQPVRVHKLGVDCPGIRAVTEKSAPVTVYRSRAAVRTDLEGEPWCAKCELAILGE